VGVGWGVLKGQDEASAGRLIRSVATAAGSAAAAHDLVRSACHCCAHCPGECFDAATRACGLCRPLPGGRVTAPSPDPPPAGSCRNHGRTPCSGWKRGGQHKGGNGPKRSHGLLCRGAAARGCLGARAWVQLGIPQRTPNPAAALQSRRPSAALRHCRRAAPHFCHAPLPPLWPLLGSTVTAAALAHRLALLPPLAPLLPCAAAATRCCGPPLPLPPATTAFCHGLVPLRLPRGAHLQICSW
jgi:hypothetical protein